MTETLHRIETGEPTEYAVTGAQRIELTHRSETVPAPDGSAGTSDWTTSVMSVRARSYMPVEHPTVDELFTVRALAPLELQPGDLLVTDQANGRVVRVRGDVAVPCLDVSSWCNAHLWDTAVSADRQRLYLSVSGMRGPVANHIGIEGSSAVLEVDTASGRLTRAFTAFRSQVGLPYTDRMVDLAGITLTADGRTVLGCDFNKWQGNGKVVGIDLDSGEVTIVADGLDQPSSLAIDGPDHVLVANTAQPHGQASGGQVVRVNLRTGERAVVAEITGVAASLIGVGRLDDGTYVGTMSEGTQDSCVLVRFDADGSHRVIWHPDPGFLGSGIAVDGDGVWVAETVRARVYRLDGSGREERYAQVYERTNGAEMHKMIRGFDSLESVTLVR